MTERHKRTSPPGSAASGEFNNVTGRPGNTGTEGTRRAVRRPFVTQTPEVPVARQN